MKLRLILLVLSLLAFISTAAGGFLYYSALKDAAIKEAERQDISHLEMIRRNLSSFLSENIKPVQTLAGMEALLEKLTRPGDPDAQDRANAILDHFKQTLGVDVCYLMDHQGITVASSNRDAPDSFVGKNFAFRPYFQRAFHSAPATYLALGTTSRKRGVYFSYPVFEKGEDLPIGLVVIKAPVEKIENQLVLSEHEIILVSDPQGVVFITSRNDWLFHTLHPLRENEMERIRASRQFGNGPWPWTGLNFTDDEMATDDRGRRFLLHETSIDEHYPDWRIIHLHSLAAISKSVTDSLIRITVPIVMSLCVFIGVAVFILYRKASHEIVQRKRVETALRQSEERYRSLYHNTPAMLHSIDSGGKLLSVSDYWAEAMGYTREEVIGRQLTDFFTPQARRYAEEKVIPQFFRTGVCKDVTYQFVRRDGTKIDVLLSAIAVHDDSGEISRSLAVSIDVTERKRAKGALQQAKEKLSHYSKDLERQVSERTREITSILRYTPDVVYIKDRRGRYQLINSRYEEIIGMTNDQVRGKTDHDLLPRAVADDFRANDRHVLDKNRPCQVEEHMPQKDGDHTYLSVKFPIYDESGETTAVCGISTDITALKKAQNQLRRLSAGIMDNQEKERAAIARELHDELGQVLTALRMDAAWMVERFKNSDARAAERALTMCDLIDKNINDVRGMAIRLRPGVLDDLGLVDALEWYAGDFEKRTGITCVFQHNTLGPIDGVRATAAYRIAQEALTNVVRHADARRVDVVLMSQNGLLELEVQDDGRGFDTTHLSDVEGLGVAGMRERAMLVGGRLDVDSRIDGGTRVRMRIPSGDVNRGAA